MLGYEALACLPISSSEEDTALTTDGVYTEELDGVTAESVTIAEIEMIDLVELGLAVLQ